MRQRKAWVLLAVLTSLPMLGCQSITEKVVGTVVKAGVDTVKSLEPPTPVFDAKTMARAGKTNSFNDAKYARIKMKMTLPQVEKVLGAPGQKMRQKPAGAIASMLDHYLWVNADKGYIICGFSDGCLISKSAKIYTHNKPRKKSESHKPKTN